MATNEEYIRKNKVVVIDDDNNTRLHYATALNNTEEVEKIIKSGHKLDPENYLGWTPLMMAVRNGNAAIIDLLLEHGANASKKNRFGASVFLLSVTSGSLEIVEKMLDHLLSGGISRRILQRDFSPISMAILYGQPQIFRYLLERLFDPNAATPLTNLTPAMFAAAMGNNKAIKTLLEHKADPKLKNYLGQTATEISQARQHNGSINGAALRQKPLHLPVIMISSGDSPYLQLTPHLGASDPKRRSSNVGTPFLCCTPDVTPIVAGTPRVFFGPDFSPGHFESPAGYMSVNPAAYMSSDSLNTAISSSTVFSPFSPQIMCLPGAV